MTAFTTSLATNKQLRSFILAGCQINDLFLTNVALGLFSSSTLESIDLSRNEISEPGIKGIVRVLKKEFEGGRKITKLNLSGNQISDAASLTIAGLLSEKIGLSCVNLANNTFSAVMVKQLHLCCQSNPQIIQLSIHGNCVDELNKNKLN